MAADAVAAALTKKKLMLAGLSPKLIVIGLGLATSVLVNLVLVLTSLIESWKVSLVAGQVLPGNEPSSSAWWLAWASWLGIGATCTLAATCCVLLAPAARSSGIPGLLAYLNGAIAPKARNVLGNLVGPLDVYTLLAKFCSTILAVASGLFVGPEGPLIHMGAMLGHLVHTIKFTRGEKVIRKMTQGRVAPHLMLPIDAEQRRDFVALGAGAAIAAAFSAPIAGVLFVIEEAGTKVTPRLLEWAFVASAAAFFVTWYIADTPSGEGHVKFDRPASPFCTVYAFSDALVFVAIAVLGGVVGAAFNGLVLMLNKWRSRAVIPFPSRQVLEVLAVTVVTCTAGVLLSWSWGCTELKPQLMMEDSAGCMKQQQWSQLSPGLVPQRDAVLYYTSGAAGSITLTPQEQQWVSELDPNSGRLMYLARNMSDIGSISVDLVHQGSCAGGFFNEMASLFLIPGVKAVTLLLTRGVPHLFSASTLVVFFFVYFLLAAYTSGISVASGLFVPHLLIGASMGRLIGLLDIYMVTASCVDTHGVDPATVSVAEWTLSGYRDSLESCGVPDPGTFAMIGAAAVMGGSGRITVFLAVIMLELTADITWMPVLAVVSIISMWVGNLINHGLYHSLIPLMGIPFLERHPHPAQMTIHVAKVMATPVVTMRAHMSCAEVSQVLNGRESPITPKPPTQGDEKTFTRGRAKTVDACTMGTPLTHQAFPVVNEAGQPIGIVDRASLRHALRKIVDTVRAQGGVDDTDWHAKDINLKQIMTRAPYTVYAAASVARAYDMFQSLGLRHLCVIAEDGCLVGIVTRKDLMAWRLQGVLIAQGLSLPHHGGKHRGHNAGRGKQALRRPRNPGPAASISMARIVEGDAASVPQLQGVPNLRRSPVSVVSRDAAEDPHDDAAAPTLGDNVGDDGSGGERDNGAGDGADASKGSSAGDIEVRIGPASSPGDVVVSAVPVDSDSDDSSEHTAPRA